MSAPQKNVLFSKALLEPLRHVIESQDLGINFNDILGYIGIEHATFDTPNFHIDNQTFVKLIRWLKEHTQDKIRLKDWLHGYSATSIGLVGLAALSSLNGRDLINVGIGYMPLFASAIRVELIEGVPNSQLSIELVANFEEMHGMMLEITAGIINILFHETMGDNLDFIIHFKHDSSVNKYNSPHLENYSHTYGCNVIFNSYFDGFIIDSNFLDAKTRSPNEATNRLTRSILDSEIEAVMASMSFGSFVKKELQRMAKNSEYPSLEQFADHIHITPRTLARRLASEDTSYKTLANDAWLTLAQELLKTTQLSINQIAHRTGFINGNSFSRAFKSLIGNTPLNWRHVQ